MKPGDLIQSKADPDLIYLILEENMDPDGVFGDFVLLDLHGNVREWFSESIKKLYKVIG